MAAITDLSDIINRATTSGSYENLFFYKDARTGSAAAVAAIAGRLTSLWNYNGQPAGAGWPSGISAPDRLSTGSLYQRINSGSSQKWLLGASISGLVQGTVFLYDRLLHQGGLNATLTTSQSVSGVITRNTSGSGNQIFLEIYEQIGASSTTVLVEYTNDAGVGTRRTPLVVFGNTGFREANRLIQMPLQVGDTGVQSVQQVKLTATTGTAGNFGVTLAKPITNIPLGIIGVGNIRDLITGIPGPIEIESGSCLAMYWLANVTTAPQLFGSLHFIDK